MTIDTDKLLASVDLVQVAGRYTQLKKHGREHVGLCPFHADGDNGNFHVIPAKGFAHCFSCGWNGDAIKIVMEKRGMNFLEACADLGSGEHVSDMTERTPRPEPEPERITSAPREFGSPGDGPPNMHTRYWGDPVKVWTYRDAEGRTLFFVARYEFMNDKGTLGKVTPQWTFGSRDGGKTWAWGMGHYHEPRPIYGLDRLAARPDAPVMIVEGEKSADAAVAMMPQYVVVTWPGGGNGVAKCDWSPLRGRGVLIWPDQDLQVFKGEHPQAGMVKPSREQPGTRAAHAVAERAHAAGAKWIKIIDVTPADSSA